MHPIHVPSVRRLVLFLFTLVLGLALAARPAGPAIAAELGTRARAVAYFDPTTREIQARARRTATRTIERADTRLERAARNIDDQVRAQADADVALRLADRFGGPADAYVVEHSSLDLSWGHLVLAHALLEHAPAGWTVDQIVALRKSRLGWGQIAAGLDLQLTSVIRSAEYEVRVATGQVGSDARDQLVTSLAVPQGMTRRR